MTNIELSNAVKALAARIAELEKKPVLTGEQIQQFVKQLLDAHQSKPLDKKLCPKCQKMPAHHMHVKYCTG